MERVRGAMSELISDVHQAMKFSRINLRPVVRCPKMQEQLHFTAERQNRVVKQNVFEKPFRSRRRYGELKIADLMVTSQRPQAAQDP